MEPEKLFKIYSSSAGSGKTFTLALAYIKYILLSSETFYFRKILAVTFTNDAANEMKIRILEYLELLSNEEITDSELIEKREQLIRFLANELPENFPKKLIQERAKIAFFTIIHHYSDFSVSTIDSFIQKIIAAFAMQLGYQNNILVSLDSTEILLPAAENFISKVGSETDKSLSDAIIAYVNQLADEGKTWNNLPESFADFAKNLFSDSKIKYLEKIQDLSLESMRVFSVQIFDYLRALEEKIFLLTSDFVKICFENNLEIIDFLNGSNGGILSVFVKRNKGIDLFTPFTKTVLKVHDNNWYKQKAEKAAEIDAIKDKLYLIFCKYEAIIDSESDKYNLLKAISKNLFKLSLLKQFRQEIDDIKTENGIIHISEFNKAILKVVANEPVPYIYERIGERFAHIMIDEFQDTSPIQFHNFLPLFTNSLSYSNTCMLVGDPKQAIYRFRGGDMSQIIQLYHKNIEKLKDSSNSDSFINDHLEQLEPYLNPQNLNTNFRSFAEIIDFNNDFFGFVKNYETFDREYALLGKTFDESYFQQKPAKCKKGAHIEIIFRNAEEVVSQNSDNEEESDSFASTDNTNKAQIEDLNLIKIIKTALADGFDFKDIAILCRKNNVARIIANYLKNNNYPIISADSILLSFSNHLNFIVDIFEILVNNNQMARYQTICHFHQYILKEGIPANEGVVKQFVDNEDLVSFFTYFGSYGFQLDIQFLNTNSIYDLAEYLIHSFNLLANKTEQEYIYAFLDQILKFKETKSDNLQEFLVNWHQNKTKLAILPAISDAITITTIHKSKGLQYPIVIVPETRWEFKMKHFEQFWVHLEAVDYPELKIKNSKDHLPIASLNPSSALNNTLIKQQFADENELYFLEAINILYVAFTRAIQKLYIITKHNISDKKIQENIKNKEKGIAPNISNVGNLLYYYIDEKLGFEAEKLNYEIYTGIKIEKNNINKIIEKEIVAIDNFNLIDKTSGISKTFVNPFDEIQRKRGNQIHAILANVSYEKDIEEAINQAVIKGEIDVVDGVEINKKIAKLVNLPELSLCFDSKAKFKNEMEILLPNGSTQRPDRVNFFEDKTVIIDYKTGLEHGDYAKQIKKYGALLAQMNFPKPEMYLVYLEDLKVIKIE